MYRWSFDCGSRRILFVIAVRCVMGSNINYVYLTCGAMLQCYFLQDFSIRCTCIKIENAYPLFKIDIHKETNNVKVKCCLIP